MITSSNTLLQSDDAAALYGWTIRKLDGELMWLIVVCRAVAVAGIAFNPRFSALPPHALFPPAAGPPAGGCQPQLSRLFRVGRGHWQRHAYFGEGTGMAWRHVQLIQAWLA